jgi:hypothetical protein
MFAVLPCDLYLALPGQHDDSDGYTPHEFIGLCVEKGMSRLAAWISCTLRKAATIC